MYRTAQEFYRIQTEERLMLRRHALDRRGALERRGPAGRRTIEPPVEEDSSTLTAH